MCGIGGIVINDKYKHHAINFEDLGKIQRALKHRGPDSAGIYISRQRCGLISTHLSTIDLKDCNQPQYNEDKSVVCVFNGKIYNYTQLRKTLLDCGHLIRTYGDGEIICHAYEEFGLNFPNMLDGVFAIAIWDDKLDSLILVRDRFGEKPLYYTCTFGSFEFSSEVQGLLAIPKDNIKPCFQTISDYLTFSYIPGIRTGIKGFFEVPPAHYIVLNNGNLKTKRYWQPDFEPKMDISIEEASIILYQELSKSVNSCISDDIPIGIFLSGGLDSSSIAALAFAQNKNVKLLSIGTNDPTTDERKFALTVAQYIKAELFCIDLNPPSLDTLHKLVRHFGQPFADTSSFPLYQLSKHANELGLKIVLTGDGADEIFGGYPRYLEIMKSPIGEAFSRNMAIKSIFDENEKSLLLTDCFLENIQEHSTLQWIKTTFPFAKSIAERFDQLIDFDLSTYLPYDILLKSDIAGMINSVEIRTPFLHHHLANKVFHFPTTFKVSRNHGKKILRKTMENILPKDILSLPKKGFFVPVESWLKTDLLLDVKEYLLSAESRTRAYFQRGFLQTLIKNEQLCIPGNSKKIWTIFMLEIWLREIFG